MGSSQLDTDDPTEDPDRRRVLLPVDGDHADRALELLCPIAAEMGATLYLAAPVTVPNQTPLDTPELESRGRRLAAKYALRAKEVCEDPGWIETVVEIGHRRPHVLQALIDTHDIEMLFTEDSATSGLEARFGIEGIDNTDIEGTCDTVYLTRLDTVEAIDSVIVPVARGPHAGLAVQIGTAIARHHDCPLELFHVYEPGGQSTRQAARDLLERARHLVEDYDAVETTLRGSTERRVKILEYTDDYDVTVFGAPREGLLRQYVDGTIPGTVAANTEGIVITAHRGGTDTSWIDRWF